MPRRRKDTEKAEALLEESESTLEALLASAGVDAGQVQSLPTGSLQPSRFQPRIEMGEEDLRELAASIEQAGIIEPLIVRPLQAGRYEIVAGERRWRAAQLAGLEEVPCLVRELDDEQTQIIALIENLHRRDLSDYERGRALRQLKRVLKAPWGEIARRVGLTRRSVLRLVRFAELPEEIEQEIGDEATARHYEAIALLQGRPRQQRELARVIREKGLTGPQAAKIARAVASGKAKSVKAAAREVVKEEKRAKGEKDEISELVAEIQRIDARVRGLTAGGLTRRQREALVQALEGLMEGIAEAVRLLQSSGR